MSGEFIEFFNELLYGSGAMVGLVIILAILLLLVLAIQYGSIVGIPASIIMIILYWENIPSYSIAMWNTIIMFFGIVLMLIIDVARARG